MREPINVVTAPALLESRAGILKLKKAKAMNTSNAKEIEMLAFERIEKSQQGEFVAKLRWIIRAAKRADGVLDAVELERVIDQYYPKQENN